MQHLPEVLKLVEGGLQRDPIKVSRYVELLARKLDLEGDDDAAGLLRRALTSIKSNGLHAAQLAPKSSPVPVDGESRVTLADVTNPAVEEVPLVLESRARAALDDFIHGYLRRDELLSAGLADPGHVLLYGPPGCGKTQAATYIAASLQLPLVTARLDGLLSSFLGSTAKNLRALFDYVDKTPCVLFLDEFDAVAKMRDDPHELGELKRVVNSLLQNIDGLPSGTAVVAATNHHHLLDPAVWRRFEFHVSIDPPDAESRAKLFSVYAPAEKMSEDDLNVLASLSGGLTAADIRRACELMARDKALARRKHLELSDAASAVFTYVARNRSNDDGPAWPEKLDKQIEALRARDSHVFTYDVISRLLGVSKGKISNVLSGRP